MVTLGFVKHLILISTLCAACGSGFAAERPNVIVFFVDDLGWTDLGCFGSDFYETPNVDRLADQGVKFTQAYAACTVCSPSRAALLTGQYPARLRVTDFIPGHRIENTPLTMPVWTQRLKLEEVTVAELLKDAGYRTAHLGKWHLTPRNHTNNPNDDGDYPEFYPEHQGFDFNIGGCERGAPSSYFWPYGRGETLDVKKRNNTFRTMPEGNAGEGTYLTDQLADEAVRLIAEFGQDPFFMYFPFYNVHTPLQGRPNLVDKYKKKLAANPDSRHRNVKYAAMVESFDEAIGRVLRQVEDQGVADRTVVVFSSDNGGLCPSATSNLPLRQGKGSIYEGGVRVPTIIKWPGVTSPATISNELVITMDLFPTVLGAAGVDIPENLQTKIDGLSLVPLLQTPETTSLDRDAIFWHYPHYHLMGAIPYSAVRAGDWKLIECHGATSLELYNIADDIHEDHNLAALQPGRMMDLQERLQEWRESVDAQMPTQNADFDSASPTGRKAGSRWKRMSVIRE